MMKAENLGDSVNVHVSVSTHCLHTETGRVTNSDAALPQPHKHTRNRSPVRSFDFSSFPEKQGTPHHIFCRASYTLTCDVEEIRSMLALWKLSRVQSNPNLPSVGDGRHFRVL